jgi:hypothetical protein
MTIRNNIPMQFNMSYAWATGHFLRNYNYWGLVSMRAFSAHSLYGYVKITLCSGAALALFEGGGGGGGLCK